jgi:hypothetical protein
LLFCLGPYVFHLWINILGDVKVSMKRRLSHDKTKIELTGYLARKALDHAKINRKRLAVVWGTE